MTVWVEAQRMDYTGTRKRYYDSKGAQSTARKLSQDDEPLLTPIKLPVNWVLHFLNMGSLPLFLVQENLHMAFPVTHRSIHAF